MRIIEPIAITDTGSFSVPGESVATRTYFDKNGVMQTAAVGQPRFTYDPLTGEYDGLLIEGEETNIIPNSNVITSGVNSSVLNDFLFASDLNLFMDALVENTSNAEHYPTDFTISTPSIGFYYIFSFFVKSYGVGAERRAVCRIAGGNNANITLNLNTETFTSSGVEMYDKGFQKLKNGIYRIWVIILARNSTGTVFRCQLDNGTTTTYLGDGISGLLIAGRQLIKTNVAPKIGSVPSSYIHTTGTTVTRYAEVWNGVMLTNVPETDYTEWTAPATFAMDERCMVTTAAYHTVYQSKIASNTGNDPTVITNADKWVEVGKTNRWKPFDGYVSSQATLSNELLYSIKVPAGSLVDSIALMNVDAFQARIIITDAVDGIVYQETINLVSESGITDYWEYFFAPVVRIQNLVRTGLPVYSGQRIDIQLLDVGGSPKVGAIIVGLGFDVGDTQYGMQIGSTDYSVKKIDEFGNITLTERPYSDELTLTAMVNNTDLAAIKYLLTRLRATPIVAIGAEDVFDEVSAAFGIIESWAQAVNYPNQTVLSFTLKGLT